MLTTKDKREDLLEGFDAGVDAYVDKVINEVSSDHPEQENWILL